MERASVKVKDGKEYDHLFPRAQMRNILKKKGATVLDTIKLIPKVVRQTRDQTLKIASVLKGKTLRETCSNIWHFVYDYIAYNKDEMGREQIRSPARTWNDRHQGVDCDCYSVFISTILYNLGIPHVLRITKYSEDHFQHIYPIVPLDRGYITIDCVTYSFDYEVPYSDKHDTKMDLEFLNGIDNTELALNADARDLMGAYDDRAALQELGKLFKKKSAGGTPDKRGGLKEVFKKGALKQAFKEGGVKAVVKKSLHVVNRLNPATLLLRNGILAAMKVNLMKVPQRLKYAYLSDQQAQQRGIDMAKFARLKQVKTKLENIFFGAGGKPENLRQAILTGRGNKNKDVNLGYADPDLLSGITPQTPVSRILGRQMFYSENVEGMEGLGSLGDPATGASIAAATGAIGAIAALLKSIGNIFPKKGTGSSDYDESDTATTVTSSTDSSTTAPTVSESISSSTSSSPSTESYNSDSSSGTSTENSSTPAQRMDNNDSSQGADTQQQSNAQARAESTSQSSDSTSTSEDNTNESQGNNATGTTNANAKGQPKPGFWAANKKWLLPTSIGVSVLLLSVGGYAIVKSSKNKPAPKPSSPAVNGLPAMKKHKKKKRKRPSISSKKKSPTLFMM